MYNVHKSFISFQFRKQFLPPSNSPCCDATHQSHAPHHGDAVHALQPQVQQTAHHDHEVEDVPSVGKIFLAERRELENSFKEKERCEDLRKKIFSCNICGHNSGSIHQEHFQFIRFHTRN